MQDGNGRLLTGKLNWNKARQYPWEGRNYIDVPFEFSGYGSRVPGSEIVAPASFNLVVRRSANDSFEGAIRTVTYNAKSENLISGKQTEIHLQSYQLLDGQPANIWQSDEAVNNIRAVARIELTKEQITEMKAKGAIKTGASTLPRLAQQCYTITTTTYQTYCYYATPED